MNKKGFTLLEVVVSVVLVSLVLTAMLGALVKLKSTYSTANANTEALIFTSSLTRIINNDFEQNGGIKYIECNSQNTCDITLNNDQKRRISIYETKRGYKIKEGEQLPIVSVDTNITDEKLKKRGLVYTKKGMHTIKDKVMYCEPKRLGEPTPAGGVKIKDDSGEELSILAVVKEIPVNSNPPSFEYEEICAKEIIATTLRYTDITNLSPEHPEETNIYLKTLTLEKTNEILYESPYYALTGRSRAQGYTFGDLSYETVTYDNLNKKTTGANPESYKNTLTTIKIEIFDSIDKINSVHDIYLSSESMYSPDKQQQSGKTVCFALSATDNTENNPVRVKMHGGLSFCVKNAFNYMLRKVENNEINDIKINSGKIDKIYLPYELDENNSIPENPQYKFKGFYNNDTMVIDSNGKILVEPYYFVKPSDISLRAKWEKIEGE